MRTIKKIHTLIYDFNYLTVLFMENQFSTDYMYDCQLDFKVISSVI